MTNSTDVSDGRMRHVDGRGAFVVLTPEGRQVIAEAAPRHVWAVRRLCIEPLTPEDLRAFARVADRIVEHLEKRPSPIHD
ncbi:hypothetical protein J7F01_32350 [Streptomyces sp. ISL-22]|uniref:hypothetical protein n=1 Tax=unclassified Streptomyces TaxID=2593676 RepID=UPI001BE9AA75|nr:MULTISPECIES: hypothetical protein [unclassified Streptomyces]MBT2422368.1 hypothetical protein [Streptomyces sp. ISL-24]MBT2436765.1 hypothetical protein [Streptomyces sp. ISL-22]